MNEVTSPGNPFPLGAVFALGIIALVVGGIGLVPAIRASENHGTVGYFAAQGETCTRYQCTWHGEFELPNGTVARSSTQFYGNDPGMTAGTIVPAVDTGDPFGVYQPHNSSHWIWYDLPVIIMGVALLVLAIGKARAQPPEPVAGPDIEPADQPEYWPSPES